jgi:hypothetical protein
MDVDWRLHQRWLMVHETPIDVVDLGTGDDVIVFVHGHAGSWTNWLGQLPALSRAHRVIAPDLPGFGRSPLPNHEISMTEYARDIDDLFHGLSLVIDAWQLEGGFTAAQGDPLSAARPEPRPGQCAGRPAAQPPARLMAQPVMSGRSSDRAADAGATAARRGSSSAPAAGGDVPAHRRPPRSCRPRSLGADPRRTLAGCREPCDCHDFANGCLRSRPTLIGRPRPDGPNAGRRRVRASDPRLAEGHLRGHRPRR